MMPQLQPTQCSAVCPTRANSLGPTLRSAGEYGFREHGTWLRFSRNTTEAPAREGVDTGTGERGRGEQEGLVMGDEGSQQDGPFNALRAVAVAISIAADEERPPPCRAVGN